MPELMKRTRAGKLDLRSSRERRSKAQGQGAGKHEDDKVSMTGLTQVNQFVDWEASEREGKERRYSRTVALII
jgi:hypothetical protein